MKTYEQFKNEVLGRAYDVDGYYGPQCLVAGTMVELADGRPVAIENVKVGDKLMGGNTVVSNECRVSRTIRVTTDLCVFTCTPDHRFIDANGGEIKNVRPGDKLWINTHEPKKTVEMTEDELRFLGFYLAKGSKSYHRGKMEVYVEHNDYVLGLAVKITDEQTAYHLESDEHKTLAKMIDEMDGKRLPMIFTAEQYRYIMEGCCWGNDKMIFGSTSKGMIVSLQFGAFLNGWAAQIEESQIVFGLSSPEKPYYVVRVNPKEKPTGGVLKVEAGPDSDIYVLNTDGDHTYFADNVKHHNCWDGAMYYSKWLGYPVFHCGVTGYAIDIWTQRKTSGILKYYDEVTTMKPGDIAVFKRVAGWTPLSHIAIFDHDAGGGFGWFLGQNQGGSGGSFNLTKLPYSCTCDTAFRPKCYEKAKEIAKGPERAVYRLYNPNNGDHLYTTNLQEANACQSAGWTYEGVSWTYPNDGDPVWRLRNPNTTFHHLTSDVKEKNALVKAGWSNEGMIMRSKPKGRPIYRLYNPNTGAHVLTPESHERDYLKKAGWTYEGIGLGY